MHDFGRPELLKFKCPVCGSGNKKYIPIMYKNIRYGYALHCCNCGNITEFIAPYRSIGGLYNGQFMAGEIRDQRCLASDGCEKLDCPLHKRYISDLMHEYKNDHETFSSSNLVPSGKPPRKPFRPAPPRKTPYTTGVTPPKGTHKEYRLFLEDHDSHFEERPKPVPRPQNVEPYPMGFHEQFNKASTPPIKTAYQDKRQQMSMYHYPERHEGPFADLTPVDDRRPPRRRDRDDQMYYGVYGSPNNVNPNELEIKVGDPDYYY